MDGRSARRALALALALALLALVSARDLGADVERVGGAEGGSAQKANRVSPEAQSSGPRRSLSQWVLPPKLAVSPRSALRLPWQTRDPAAASAAMGSGKQPGDDFGDDGDEFTKNIKHPISTDYDEIDADYFATKIDGPISDPIERQLARWYRETKELDGGGKGKGEEGEADKSSDDARASKDSKKSESSAKKSSRIENSKDVASSSSSAEKLGWKIQGEEVSEDVSEGEEDEEVKDNSKSQDESKSQDKSKSHQEEEVESGPTVSKDSESTESPKISIGSLPMYYAKSENPSYVGKQAIYVSTDKKKKITTDSSNPQDFPVTTEELAADEKEYLQWVKDKRKEEKEPKVEHITHEDIDAMKDEVRDRKDEAEYLQWVEEKQIEEKTPAETHITSQDIDDMMDETEYSRWIDQQKHVDDTISSGIAESMEQAAKGEFDTIKKEKAKKMEILKAARDAISQSEILPKGAVDLFDDVEEATEAILEEDHGMDDKETVSMDRRPETKTPRSFDTESDIEKLSKDLAAATKAFEEERTAMHHHKESDAEDVDETVKDAKPKPMDKQSEKTTTNAYDSKHAFTMRLKQAVEKAKQMEADTKQTSEADKTGTQETSEKPTASLGKVPKLGRDEQADLLESTFLAASRHFNPEVEVVPVSKKVKETGTRKVTRTSKQSEQKNRKASKSEKDEAVLSMLKRDEAALSGHKFPRSSAKKSTSKHGTSSSGHSKSTPKSSKHSRTKHAAASTKTPSQEIEDSIRGLMDKGDGGTVAAVGKLTAGDDSGDGGSKKTSEDWARDEAIGLHRARVGAVSSIGVVLFGLGFFVMRQKLLQGRGIEDSGEGKTPTSGLRRESQNFASRKPRRSNSGGSEKTSLLPTKTPFNRSSKEKMSLKIVDGLN